MEFLLSGLAAFAAMQQFATAIPLDTQDPNSVRSASETLAYGLMSFYKNNQSSTPVENVGTLQPPLYWCTQ
jgi:mannan endo-1,6-alpha-mannosidase